jgi:hypothetical protein
VLLHHVIKTETPPSDGMQDYNAIPTNCFESWQIKFVAVQPNNEYAAVYR